MITVSPLRYPGGKASLAGFLEETLRINGLAGCCFVEPFGGGAGAALSLLVGEHVDSVVINDLDPAIHAFWVALLTDTEAFIDLLHSTPLTIDEWDRQRNIYRQRPVSSLLQLGFAAFYLNRCNRSGIIHNGGVIGGRLQIGRWKIDARFDRSQLEQRLRLIASFSERITVCSLHGLDLLQMADAHAKNSGDRVFCFIDPPYVEKGRLLYFDGMDAEDHEQLANYLSRRRSFSWILTYDDCDEVRDMYDGFDTAPLQIAYSASRRRAGEEVLMASPGLLLPSKQSSLRVGWK